MFTNSLIAEQCQGILSRAHDKPEDFLLSTEQPHVLYEGEEWMVVQKPAGWLTSPLAGCCPLSVPAADYTMPAGIVFKRQADPLPKTNTADVNTCIPLDSSLCVEHWLRQPVAEQSELVEAGLCKRLER
jgi:hypothetical protein